MLCIKEYIGVLRFHIESLENEQSEINNRISELAIKLNYATQQLKEQNDNI